MDQLGQLASELGDVSFEEFMTEARARRLNASAWLKAKQRGLLVTYKSDDGVLHVAPPGGVPEHLQGIYPDRSVQ